MDFSPDVWRGFLIEPFPFYFSSQSKGFKGWSDILIYWAPDWRYCLLLQLCTIILIIRLVFGSLWPRLLPGLVHMSLLTVSPDRSNKSCTVHHLLDQSDSVSDLTSSNVTVSPVCPGTAMFPSLLRKSENQTNQSLMRYICNRDDKSWTRTMFSISLPFYLITVDWLCLPLSKLK